MPLTAYRPLRLTAVLVALLSPTGVSGQEPSDVSESLYFPSPAAWKTVDPSIAGWDEAGLNDALDFAMSRKSAGVVVLYRGRMLAERYQAVTSPARRYLGVLHGKDDAGHVIEDVASVQKSVASVLVGIAQQKGLLKITDPVHEHLGTGWSNATLEQESRITIQHLITMSSGLDSGLRFVAPPGVRWRYNTEAYCLSLKATAAAAKLTPNELTKAWLTKPIGMSSSRWIKRRLPPNSPPETNPFGFVTTARDLARFGLLMLARGQWGESAVLSDHKYLADSLSTSQQMNPSYGYLWWLNGKASAVRGDRPVAGPLNRNAPNDLVAALGALGRKCYVVPSLNLVVTRLGDTPDTAESRFDPEFWRRLMKAAPTSGASE